MKKLPGNCAIGRKFIVSDYYEIYKTKSAYLRLMICTLNQLSYFIFFG